MRYLMFVALTAACGGSGSDQPDAPATGDAPAADAAIDGGPCGGRELTGQFVDWDSSNAVFKGIAGARFTVQGMPAMTATTAPNGRIILCVPATGAVQLAVDAPDTYVDGTAYVDDESITQTTQTIDFRSFTNLRKAEFYMSRGLTYNPAKAHVLVFLTGDRTTMSLNRMHDTAQGGEDTGDGAISWGNDGGRYILFPNVAVEQPTATLTGDPMGPHTFTIAPNQLTLVAVHFVFI